MLQVQVLKVLSRDFLPLVSEDHSSPVPGDQAPELCGFPKRSGKELWATEAGWLGGRGPGGGRGQARRVRASCGQSLCTLHPQTKPGPVGVSSSFGWLHGTSRQRAGGGAVPQQGVRGAHLDPEVPLPRTVPGHVTLILGGSGQALRLWKRHSVWGDFSLQMALLHLSHRRAVQTLQPCSRPLPQAMLGTSPLWGTGVYVSDHTAEQDTVVAGAAAGHGPALQGTCGQRRLSACLVSACSVAGPPRPPSLTPSVGFRRGPDLRAQLRMIKGGEGCRLRADGSPGRRAAEPLMGDLCPAPGGVAGSATL